MLLVIPAILTLGGLPACILAAPVSISTHSTAGMPHQEIPPLETVHLQLDPPARVPLTTLDGRRMPGPWAAMTVEGLEAEDRTSVAWSDLAASERLRVGRRIMSGVDTRAQAGWGLLVVALGAIEQGPMVDRAAKELRRRTGARWPLWEEAVADALARRRSTLEERRRAVDAERLLRIPPHLKFDRPAAWPELDPDRRREVAESQRVDVLKGVEGLDYASVATDRTLVVGPGSVDEQARFGVRVDRLQDDVVGFLGLSPESISWPGRMVVIRASDRRTARILAAEVHRAAWPDQAESLVIPTDQGPIVILAPMENPQAADAELVRAIARGVLPYLETGRQLPPWLVEGISEATADHLVPAQGIDRRRRPRAHRPLRAGRDPVWISTLSMDDPAWGPDGLARDVAQVMTLHLQEHDPAAMATVIRGIKRGEGVDAAFQAAVGMTFPQWTADSLEWFHFND